MDKREERVVNANPLVQVCHIQPGIWKISKAKAGNLRVQEQVPGANAINESDANADACCLGKNFIVQACANRTADTHSCETLAAPIANVPIVTSATAWDCPSASAVHILVFSRTAALQ